jgi:O-antigen ligase
MIYERPLLGHGIRLDEEYRTPYYDQIGLSNFSKKYPAHNQLLQIQAESGLIGLVFFMAWIIINLKIFNQLDRKNSLIFKQTLLILLMAGLTQNAFQDSEVRFILTLLFSAALLRLSESVSQYDALGAQSSDLEDRKSARHKKYETRLPA